VRRLLAICAVTVAILVAFSVARKNSAITHAAPSNPGNLVFLGAQPGQDGCPLGPAFAFCDQVPATQGPASQFAILALTTVNNVSVSFAPVPGFSANFATGDFTITVNGFGQSPCSGSVPANQDCFINVAFSPTAPGLRVAALTVTDAEGDLVAINIQGTAKDLTLASPITSGGDNAYVFPTEPVGTASIAVAFALRAGSAVTGLGFSFAATSGLDSTFAFGDFTKDNANTTCGTSMAAAGSCTLSLKFTPTAAGLRSATITATDSDGHSTSLYLAGTATAGVMTSALQLSGFGGIPLGNPPPCAQVSVYGFCNEPSGGVSAAKAFLIRNLSGAQITGLTIPKGSVTPNSSTPPDFTVQSTTCASTLDANKSCTISVAFTPQSTGLRQGAIVVTDAQGDIAAVNLAGTGDDYSLSLESGQTQELTVVAGGTATFKAQVAPDSVFGMNGEQVTFTCPANLPTNTSCTITPCPASVTAGTPASFQIALVTSSATTVAPVPPQSTGCASYGLAGFFSPSVRGPALRLPPAPVQWALDLRFPAPFFATSALVSILVALAFALGVVPGRHRRTRIRLFFVAASVAVAALTGCHHKASTGPTSATPASVTTMAIQGNALDSSGKPLDASRPLQIILDVKAK
jgi:hypothetical protein